MNDAGRGIFFIILAMSCISVNDMLIKHLSGDYPLHQMIFVRSAIGIAFSLVILQFEGGFPSLRTDRPGLHLLRGLLIVAANMAFFAALAVTSLAEATALFFVAPLIITVLSVPLLGEKVGIRRLIAVLVGFSGVLVVLLTGGQPATGGTGVLVLLLPIVAALAYALMQILTRHLGRTSSASAMAIYIQGSFILVSLAFWLVAGDGRYAEGHEGSVAFLLRAWHWPAQSDFGWFLLLGLMSAIIGYSISQAYRSAAAATVAPFEYVALPLSIMWGWVVFGHFPDFWLWVGIGLIAASGLYVFIRERQRDRTVAARRPFRRH